MTKSGSWDAVLLLRSEEIREEAVRRGIPYLVHFTVMDNLESILSNGLAPRAVLDAYQAPYVYTDEVRLDGRLDAVSLSVTAINYRMLRSKQDASRRDWVVLYLEPSILWEAPCLFHAGNAANARRASGDLSNSYSFTRMFGDIEDSSPYPKDRQAEVQALAIIRPSAIMGVQVETTRAANRARELFDSMPDREREVRLGDFSLGAAAYPVWPNDQATPGPR